MLAADVLIGPVDHIQGAGPDSQTHPNSIPQSGIHFGGLQSFVVPLLAIPCTVRKGFQTAR